MGRELIARLFSCQWIDQTRNLVILGKSSVGKTYLAQALLNAACRKFSTARFQPLLDQTINQAISDAVALAASFGLSIPGLAVPAPQPIPAPAPVAGSCDVSVIARDIGVPQMDTVLYCNRQWARVNQDRTDWLITVRWDGQRWFNPAYDGESWAGLGSGCYTREHMNRLGGAPEGMHIQYCEPDTSRLF